MSENVKDQEFVEYVIKSIVDNPDDVSTERTVDEMGVLLTLKVNPEDMGNVIGRSGQTARALRTLLRVVGAKNNSRVNLKIYEPEGSRQAHQERREAAQAQAQSETPVADTATEDVPDPTSLDDLNL